MSRKGCTKKDGGSNAGTLGRTSKNETGKNETDEERPAQASSGSKVAAVFLAGGFVLAMVSVVLTEAIRHAIH
jgi:hypothetical protein